MAFARSRLSRIHSIKLACGASALALAFTAQPAWAQDTAEPDAQTATTAQDEPEADDIIVTGIRASLQNAQSIKRNADTVVDAISAEDIAALPDRSVNEALQRIPGVAITRFAAPNDSAHFSVEGSGVVVRGLSYVRGEFNGRDAFSVSGGREIGFSDVPTELVGSIEVFKGLTADLIEGGISGTVSINTRKPFDSSKDVFYLSASNNYGDFIRKSAPSFAGLASKTWDLPGGGRVGALVAGSYSRQYNRSDRVFLSSFLPRFNAPNDGVDGYAVNGDFQGSQFDGILCDGNNPNEGRIINAGTPYAVRVCDAFQTPDGVDTVYTPLGGGFGTQEFDRERSSVSGALQYENADRTFLVTAQYLRALSKENWVERTTEPSVYYNDIGNTFPAGTLAPNQFSPDNMTTPGGYPFMPSNQFTFDENGVFTSGTLEATNATQQHNVPNPPGCVIPNQGFPYTNGYCPYPQLVRTGTGVRFTNRYNETRSLTQDASLNLKWSPTERLHLTFDGQYAKSEANQIDDVVDLQSYANPTIDLRGDIPQITFGTPGFDTTRYFSGVDSTIFYNNAYNNRTISDGEEWAFRADAEYDLSEDGFLRKIRVGGRYADRQQIVRSNDYNNWGNLSATYTDAGPSFVNQVAPGAVGLYTYDDFFRGGTAAPPASPFIREEILRNHEALMDLLRGPAKTPSPANGFVPSYTPIEDRTGDLIQGYFRPGEIYENSEKTYAGYVRLDFGADLGGERRISGNIGARYVHTQDDSVGAITYPSRTQVIGSFADFATYCAAQQTQISQPPPPGPVNNAPPQRQLPALCRPGVTDAQRNAVLAFADGTQLPQTATQKFDNFLPSLNIRFDLTDKLLFRFAASRAISRPNFGDLRNFVSIGFDGSTGAFTARSSNPFLRPIRSDQFDLTAEWYFARVGSLTAAAFYKKLDGVILNNSGFSRDIENNGSTYTLELIGPANSPGETSIKGLELGYQQTYDFLPGILSGLGVQATYTYIDAGKVEISPPDYRPSADPTPLEGDGNQPPLDVQGLYDDLELPGLSNHNFNASVFYDRKGVYLRAAYSWRSKYLLTNRDCCFPFLPVYAASYGQLDGSAFLTVNENFKLGLEVQNILDGTTKTVFRLNGDGLESPRQFSKADRTYTLSARMSF